MQIANVANVYQATQAAVTILNPSGSTVWTDTVSLGIRTGPPLRYDLGVVPTSGWAEGVYPIRVELLAPDGSGQRIPDGLGYGQLSVGQAVQASHAVVPALVPPGTVTVTTLITTTVKP